MNAAPTTPAPARDADLHPCKHLIVCLTKMPATADPAGMLLESFGSAFLHQLLENQLRHHGIELPDAEKAWAEKSFSGTTGSLHRAIALFSVRDLGGAVKALRLLLEKFPPGLFVIGFIDHRENFYRQLWPEKQFFDFHKHVEDVMNHFAQMCDERKAVLRAFIENRRRPASETPPPASPDDTPPA